MRIFFANCSTQLQTVNYRISKEPGRGFQTQEIGMARQERIAGDDLSEDQIESIVKQQTRYGAVAVDDVDQYEGYYLPMIYSVEKPVPEKVWRHVIERNKTVKRDEGAKLRRDAAIATSHGMREYSPQAADNLSMSVEEEKPGTMDHGGERPLAEGYRMTREESF